MHLFMYLTWSSRCAQCHLSLRRPAATSGLRIVSCGVEGVFVWTIQERKFKSSRIDLHRPQVMRASRQSCTWQISGARAFSPTWQHGWLAELWSQSSKSIVGSWHVRDADQNQRDIDHESLLFQLTCNCWSRRWDSNCVGVAEVA